MLGMVRCSFLLAPLLVILAACGETGLSSGGQDTAALEELRPFTYKETTSGLETLIRDLIEAAGSDNQARVETLARSLQLDDPQAWFRDTYGNDLGSELYREYVPVRGRLGELATLVAELSNKEGLTELRVERFTRPGDEDSVGYQSAAIERMAKPTPLYSVRLYNGDGTKVFHLWSFVYQAGWFRWVGKTKRVVEERPQGDDDVLEYRLRHAAAASKQKKKKSRR